ncbi:hypothetical protein CT19425_U470008 [Cupriavidus taiwanensis]|uniref:Uncharacterized protein n=1 Tax=Cupriavidus taiwanensis TaxID=164546 RepID=A0A375I9U9_9BURK|nr:hypothetical protein CT19425_U470008 [Cupriavidus taiwanensis]
MHPSRLYVSPDNASLIAPDVSSGVFSLVFEEFGGLNCHMPAFVPWPWTNSRCTKAIALPRW